MPNSRLHHLASLPLSLLSSTVHSLLLSPPLLTFVCRSQFCQLSLPQFSDPISAPCSLALCASFSLMKSLSLSHGVCMQQLPPPPHRSPSLSRSLSPLANVLGLLPRSLLHLCLQERLPLYCCVCPCLMLHRMKEQRSNCAFCSVLTAILCSSQEFHLWFPYSSNTLFFFFITFCCTSTSSASRRRIIIVALLHPIPHLSPPFLHLTVLVMTTHLFYRDPALIPFLYYLISSF